MSILFPWLFACRWKQSSFMSSVINDVQKLQLSDMSDSVTNWKALWKNRTCSTTMKLRKSLVKPVTWQNISSCLVHPPEIVMYTMHLMLFSERPPIYASCMTILGGRTEQHVIIAGFLLCHWLYKWFSRAEQPNNML